MENKKYWFCTYTASIISDEYVEEYKACEYPVIVERINTYLHLTLDELLQTYDDIVVHCNEVLGQREFSKVKTAYRLANNLEKPLES